MLSAVDGESLVGKLVASGLGHWMSSLGRRESVDVSVPSEK